jgi:asparagine synthetase B (glutamine-hydrolysing)
LLSRAVRDAGYKVVYTGGGSDEIFGGYVHFRTDLLQHNAEGQDPAEVQRMLQELETANKVSRGLLIPAANTGPLQSTERFGSNSKGAENEASTYRDALTLVKSSVKQSSRQLEPV